MFPVCKSHTQTLFQKTCITPPNVWKSKIAHANTFLTLLLLDHRPFRTWMESCHRKNHGWIGLSNQISAVFTLVVFGGHRCRCLFNPNLSQFAWLKHLRKYHDPNCSRLKEVLIRAVWNHFSIEEKAVLLVTLVVWHLQAFSSPPRCAPQARKN